MRSYENLFEPTVSIGLGATYMEFGSSQGFSQLRSKQITAISEPMHTMATRPLRSARQDIEALVLLLAVIAGCASMQSAQPLVAGAGQAQGRRRRNTRDDRAGARRADLRMPGEERRERRIRMGVRRARGRTLRRVGSRIGKHYAGPTWESNDGSKIVGRRQGECRRAGSRTQLPGCCSRRNPVGPAGAFSKFTSVQRVNTVGGVAPKTGCSQAATGTPARINYTADYYFSRAEVRSPIHPD